MNSIINSGTINGNITQISESGKASDASNVSREETGTGVGRVALAKRQFDYDVAVSYASEDEAYVLRVVKILRAEGLRVFFALDCEEEYVAQNMISSFYEMYRYRSMFVVAFVSKFYIEKDITMHEAATAMLRARDEGRNCLIPVYMDDSVLQDLDPDINYISVKRKGTIFREVQVADKILRIVKKYAGGNKCE